ncbi:flagellin [Bacillus badius]|uniref:flagellin N-terminal helical domain-containing protein n=1 Tax=Bacillus badius TaxID=1455 RepID=UPI000596B9D9|nr:flagellin [Bacillus badius]KIL71938.1 Flagellin protein FlaA [Bacillus badius]
MRINHNIAALNTYRQLNSANGAQGKSMEKLSSGLRINRAGDDAAGLAISEKMRGQIRGLDMASKNSQDAISLIQTAEGALNETHDILQRMRELAVQSANDTNTDDDRKELQKEVTQLQTELSRISTDTNFNTKTLLDGSLGKKFNGATTNTTELGSVKIADGGSLVAGNSVSVNQVVTHAAESAGGLGDGAFEKVAFELTLGDGATGTTTVEFTKAELDAGTTSKEITIGDAKFTVDVKDAATLSASKANGAAAKTTDDKLTLEDNSLTFHIGANSNQSITLDINDMSSKGLKVDALDISTQKGADAAITTIDDAIKSVSAERSKLGAYQNRLEHTINNLNTSSENLTAAESRIRDVDMAREMMEQTKNSILSQASQAMLAQANQQPQGVLQLLR